MFDHLFSSTQPLEKGLDAVWLRHQVISNNIANVDTPNFKTSSVEFESVFESALENAGVIREGDVNLRKAGPALKDASATVGQDQDTTMRMDGNNVDIDAENAALAKNTIYYNTLVQKLNAEFQKLQMAISEGR